MAGTNFSPDSGNNNAGGAGGRPIGAGPGPMDRASDRQRPKPQRSGGGRAGAAPGGQQPQPTPQLGHPGWGQPKAEEPPPVGDYRHVQLLAQHSNIGRLGRDTHFGHWTNLTGEFRQLLGKGQLPFDIFEDGP